MASMVIASPPDFNCTTPPTAQISAIAVLPIESPFQCSIRFVKTRWSTARLADHFEAGRRGNPLSKVAEGKGFPLKLLLPLEPDTGDAVAFDFLYGRARSARLQLHIFINCEGPSSSSSGLHLSLLADSPL